MRPLGARMLVAVALGAFIYAAWTAVYWVGGKSALVFDHVIVLTLIGFFAGLAVADKVFGDKFRWCLWLAIFAFFGLTTVSPAIHNAYGRPGLLTDLSSNLDIAAVLAIAMSAASALALGWLATRLFAWRKQVNS